MKVSKVIFYLNSPVVTRGLQSYIQSLVPGIDIEIADSRTKLTLVQTNYTNLIVLDPLLLTAPRQHTLEKMRRNAAESLFIAFTENEIPELIQPYFDQTIYSFDSDEIINHKLLQVMDIKDEEPSVKEGNRILSDREIEVLKWVALGKTNKEISDTLNISAHTVITHRKNITAKLGIKTIAGLAVYAILNGIISHDALEK